MRQLKIHRTVTERNSYVLEKYLYELARQSLLTPHSEAELSRRIRDGDPVAKEKLIRGNLRFVVSVAKQYVNYGLPLPDLINEGNLGLIRAVNTFDETKGFKFISYAVWWVRQYIIQAISYKARTIRLPANRVDDLRRIQEAHDKLEQELYREPSQEEVNSRLKIKDPAVWDYFSMFNKPVSLDDPPAFAESPQGTIADEIASEDYRHPDCEYYEEKQLRLLYGMIKKLRPEEEKVLVRIYGLNGYIPRTFEQAGYDLNMSRENVRQIKHRAVRKLKRWRKKREKEKSK